MLERTPLDRRDDPFNVPAAVEVAIAAAWGGPVPNLLPAARAARMIAEGVERNGAIRVSVGRKPAHHGRHHQAETMLAMG